MGGVLTGVWLGAIALTFLDTDPTATGSEKQDKGDPKLHWPIIALSTMIWSSFSAYRGTRFDNNRGAENFSILLTPSKSSPKVSLAIRF